MESKLLVAVLFIGAQLCTAYRSPYHCTCTREIENVCGSDGKTYTNICFLNCVASATHKRITVAKYGSCTEESNTGICGCSLTYVPVCGSDGSTYPNMCHVECKAKDYPSLSKTYDGECVYN